MAEGIANLLSTTLRGTGQVIDNQLTSTSLPVTDPAPSALSGLNFAIIVNFGQATQEIMEVTAGQTTTTWTVTRASEGFGPGAVQTAFAHNAGEPVQAVITAQGLQNFIKTLVSLQVIRTQLATKFTCSTTVPKVMLSGSFTALSTRGELRIEIAGYMVGGIAAFTAFELLWGTAATPLFTGPSTNGGMTLKSGVTLERIGNIGNGSNAPESLGSIEKTIPLSGLTPGTTYNWQITASVPSGSYWMVGSQFADTFGSGFTDVIGTPDRRKLYIGTYEGPIHILNTDVRTGGSVGDFNMHEQYGGDIYALGDTVSHWPNGVVQMAMTPGGTRLVSVHSGGANGGNVVVMDTSTDTVINRQGGGSVQGVACAGKSSTTAWTSIGLIIDTSGWLSTTAWTLGGPNTLVEGNGIAPGTYVSSVVTPTTATAWAATTAYTYGQVVRPPTANGHLYVVQVPGTSGAAAPTFPTNGGSVADGTVTWLDVGTANVGTLSATPTTPVVSGTQVFYSMTYAISYSAGVAFPFNPGTGGFGTSATLGTNPSKARATPDGTKVYVIQSGGASLWMINTATNAVTTIALPTGANAADLAVMPDSSAVWVVNGQNWTVTQVLTATNTLGVTSAGMAGGKPQCIAIDPDGLSAWVGGLSTGSQHTVPINQLWVSGPYAGQWFLNWNGPPAPTNGNVYAVYIDTWGFISYTDFDQNHYHEWPIGQFVCDPTSGFVNDFAQAVYADVA